MKLAEQAARRVDLARAIGVEPHHWVATSEAAAALLTDTLPGAWSADGSRFFGIPFAYGTPQSEWGLELVLAPRRA